MTTERREDDSDPRAERALDRLEERVREVRHLHPFSLSRREDGRFACELQKPLSELTEEEGRAAADALEELARAIREAVGRRSGRGGGRGGGAAT